jgi:hypothetical protein
VHARIQQTLEPLIAIGGEIKNAVVGRNREWDAAGQASRAAVSVGRVCSRWSMQHETCGVDHSAGHSHGIGRSSLPGICETLKFGKHTATRVEDSVHQASLRKRETTPRESRHFPRLCILLVLRPPNVWTGLGIQRACIGKAAIVLKDIRAQCWLGMVLNICTYRGAELFRDLHGGIAYDDVVAEYVTAFSSCTKEYAIEVSADLVFFDEVAAACAN